MARTKKPTKKSTSKPTPKPKPKPKPKPEAAPTLYFDRPETGPSKATSHPSFVAICKDAWFYDPSDDFAPFGNDEGNDVLGSLTDWFGEKRVRKMSVFVKELFSNWGYSLKRASETDRATVLAWLEKDEENVTELWGMDRALIATAFAQMKIAGSVDDDIHALAMAALERAPILREYNRKAYPDWEYGAEKDAADKKLRAALAAMR